MCPRQQPSNPSALRSTVSAAAWSAVIAAASGLAACVVVTLLTWLPDSAASGSASSAVRAGVFAFLYAHRGGGVLDSVSVTFLPLGLLMLVGGLSFRAGRGLAGEPGRTAAALMYGVCYAGLCAFAVPFARIGTTHVDLVPTAAAALVVATAFALAGAHRGTVGVLVRAPGFGATVTRAGLCVVALYVFASSLLGLVSLITHQAKVTELSQSVGGGVSGFGVAAVGMLSVPNAVIDGVAYLAGPGFNVGQDTFVSPFAHSVGVLPSFPLLGALPQGHGAGLPVLVLMAVIAVLAGAVVSRVALRAAPSLRWALLAALAASGFGGALTGTLCLLASGSAGSARLEVVGASPWRVGGALAGEVGTLSVLFVLLAVGLRELNTWLVGRATRDDHAGALSREEPSVGEPSDEASAATEPAD